MATIIDSILSGSDPGRPSNGKTCFCGHCPQCQRSRTGVHRNWRDRRNARYFGASGETGSGANAAGSGGVREGAGETAAEGEITRVRSSAPVARKSIPGAASRVIPLRGPRKQALEKKWTDKMNSATHPRVKDRYGRYADTVRNNARPSPDQSEKDLLPLFRRQALFFYRPRRVIQIFNYNIRWPHALIRLLKGKARLLRGKSAPLIILDLRGQEKGAGNLFRLIERLANGSGYPAGRIKLVTW